MKRILVGVLIASLVAVQWPRVVYSQDASYGYSTIVNYYTPTAISGGLNINAGFTKQGPHLGGINQAWIGVEQNQYDHGTSAEIDSHTTFSTYDAHGTFIWHEVWDELLIDKSGPITNGVQTWWFHSYRWDSNGDVGWANDVSYPMNLFYAQHSNWNIQIALTQSVSSIQSLANQLDNEPDMQRDPVDQLGDGGIQTVPGSVWPCMMAAYYACSAAGVQLLGPLAWSLCVAFLLSLCVDWPL